MRCGGAAPTVTGSGTWSSGTAPGSSLALSKVVKMPVEYFLFIFFPSFFVFLSFFLSPSHPFRLFLFLFFFFFFFFFLFLPRYQCKTCKKIYGRHSKSIKIQYQRCGVCTGELFLLPQLKADGTPMKKRAPSEWQLFCKKNMAYVTTLAHPPPHPLQYFFLANSGDTLPFYPICADVLYIDDSSYSLGTLRPRTQKVCTKT